MLERERMEGREVVETMFVRASWFGVAMARARRGGLPGEVWRAKHHCGWCRRDHCHCGQQ